MNLLLYLVPLMICLSKVSSAGYQQLQPEKMMIKVEPKSEQCFYEDFRRNTNVEFLFSVLDGGLLDIDVRVYQGQMKIFSKLYYEGRDEGKYEFTTSQDGAVGFCFNNEMSRFTVKTLTFKVTTKRQEQIKREDLSPLEGVLKSLSENLEVVEQEQASYRVREHAHRNTAESTNTRVYTWSLIESCILLTMSLGQIFYLRRLFDDSKRRRTV